MVRYNESLSCIKWYLWGKWPIINSGICSLILNLKIKYQALNFLLKKYLLSKKFAKLVKISKLLKGTDFSG